MTFMDAAGICVMGELGVRHGGIVFVTEDRAQNMTKWSGTPEDPAII